MPELFTIAYDLILITIFGMGAIVLFGNYKSLHAWVFFLFIMSAIGWLISLYLGWSFVDIKDWHATLLAMRSAYGFSVFGLTFMTVFLYAYPQRNLIIPQFMKVSYLAFTLSLGIAGCLTPLVNSALVIENGEYIMDSFGPLFAAYVFVILLNIFLSAYFAFAKYRLSYGVMKLKMGILSAGYMLFVLAAVTTNILLPLFGIFVFQRESQLSILAFIFPAFYAIQKFRFFNLTEMALNLSRRLIFYSIFLAFCYSSYNLINYAFPRLDLILNAGISVIAAIYILEGLNNITPEFFTQNIRELRTKLNDAKGAIHSAESYEDFVGLIEKLFEVNINYLSAKVYVVRKSPSRDQLRVYVANKFTQELAQYKKDALIEDEIDFRHTSKQVKNYLKKELEALDADGCIPLFSEGNLIGFFAFKRHPEAPPLGRQELGELLSFSQDMSIGLMNVLLKMNLEDENDLMKKIINQKTRLLKKKINEINELLKQQADFIAVTAHEFRTPLSIAMFQLDEVKDKSKKSDLADELGVINHSLDNLKELTQKLFSVQQYDLKKVDVKMEKIDIGLFMQGIFKDFSPIMKEKKFKFTFQTKLPSKTKIAADPSQLRQLFHNLLNNASKFTPQGGKIKLSVNTKEKDVLICVADNGEGIPDNMKKAVFAKFRTKKAGHGIGLGLYLCKKIVELHKGKIWAQDAEGGGAEFCVQLKKSAK